MGPPETDDHVSHNLSVSLSLPNPCCVTDQLLRSTDDFQMYVRSTGRKGSKISQQINVELQQQEKLQHCPSVLLIEWDALSALRPSPLQGAQSVLAGISRLVHPRVCLLMRSHRKLDCRLREPKPVSRPCKEIPQYIMQVREYFCWNCIVLEYPIRSLKLDHLGVSSKSHSSWSLALTLGKR